MYVAHLIAARLPLLRRRPRSPLEPGRHGVHRPQRPGQDQPGRGDRLPRPGSASHRVAADAPLVRAGAERAVVRGGGGARRARRRCSRSRSTRAGPTGRGSTGRRCPGPASWSGWCARCVFAPEDLALVKGDPSERRALPRRPAGAADAAAGRRPRRLRPGAQAAQLPAQDRRRRARGVGVAGVGAVARSASGTPTWPGRRRAARRAGCAWSRTLRPLRRQRPTRRSPAARRSDDAEPRVPAAALELGGRAPTAPTLTERAARRARAPARRRARPRRLPGRPAPRRAGAHARHGEHRLPVQGLRLATASPGRSRWRCGWRRTTCCAPTATTRS